MKKCELCDSMANMYCESDQASLCWDCDIKVHGANFLVAKHSRTLLCHVCQSPTPWKASGLKLGPNTVSVCETCVSNKKSTNEEEEDDDDDDDDNDDDEDEDKGERSIEEGDDQDDGENGGDENEGGNADGEDEENQVVPWSSSSSAPQDSNSQSDEESFSFSSSTSSYSSKRKRYNNAALQARQSFIY